MVKDKYITIPQLADFLGISRVAVYKKVKKGQIQASKIGRNYVITDPDILNVLQGKTTAKDKKLIAAVVKKTVRQYGRVLKKLGKE